MTLVVHTHIVHHPHVIHVVAHHLVHLIVHVVVSHLILIVVHLHLVHISHLLPLLHLVLVVGLGLLSFTPFILNHVVVFGNSLLNRRFILKCHESESFVWTARVV